MDVELQKKLLEDVSYLRGRFDTIIPQMEKSAENINQILLLHKEILDGHSTSIATIKTKVALFGALAGALSSFVLTIILGVINHFLFSK
jgi:hypothetical protein